MRMIRIDDPSMDETMFKWIVGEAHKNYWRVARWYELDDLVQDGYLAWAKCKARYGHLTAVDKEIYDDILLVSNLKRKKDEKALDFTKRVVSEAKSSNEIWSQFRKATQEWADAWSKADSENEKHLPLLITTEELRKWFMLLVQRAYHNIIYDLAMERTQSPDIAEAAISEGEEQLMVAAPANDIAEAVSVLLRAPSEILELIRALAERADEGNSKGRRETTNQMYCRLIGADPARTNMVEMVSEYLS